MISIFREWQVNNCSYLDKSSCAPRTHSLPGVTRAFQFGHIVWQMHLYRVGWYSDKGLGLITSKNTKYQWRVSAEKSRHPHPNRSPIWVSQFSTLLSILRWLFAYSLANEGQLGREYCWIADLLSPGVLHFKAAGVPASHTSNSFSKFPTLEMYPPPGADWARPLPSGWSRCFYILTALLKLLHIATGFDKSGFCKLPWKA